jgi:hypothetical protein
VLKLNFEGNSISDAGTTISSAQLHDFVGALQNTLMLSGISAGGNGGSGVGSGLGATGVNSTLGLLTTPTKNSCNNNSTLNTPPSNTNGAAASNPLSNNSSNTAANANGNTTNTNGNNTTNSSASARFLERQMWSPINRLLAGGNSSQKKAVKKMPSIKEEEALRTSLTV